MSIQTKNTIFSIISSIEETNKQQIIDLKEKSDRDHMNYKYYKNQKIEENKVIKNYSIANAVHSHTNREETVKT